MKTLMATVADGEGDFTVLLSSHNVGELERVCDHLVLITEGRVQLAGDIDALLDSHTLADRSQRARPGRTWVIHVDRADRYAHVVAQVGEAAPMPGWEARPVSLEELVLAYLERSQSGASATYPEKELQS